MLSSEAGGMLTGRRTRFFTIRIFSARKNKRMSFTRTIALSVRSPTLYRRPGDELEAGKETRARLETHAGTEYPAEYQVRQNGWDSCRVLMLPWEEDHFLFSLDTAIHF